MNKPKFFYSRNCQLCKYLAENVSINWDEWFDMICIDSKVIRDKIVNSKNVKINKVPCILVSQLSEKNKTLIHKYEGVIVKEWIIQNIIKPLNEGKKEVIVEVKKQPQEVKKQPLKKQIKEEPKKDQITMIKDVSKPLKSSLKKTVKFDLPTEKKSEVSFVDETEINKLKGKKTSLKERLDPIIEEEKIEDEEEIEPLIVEVVEQEQVGENPYIQKKKDVKGTSAVLEAAQRMRMERDESIKDENGKLPEDEE